MYTTTDCGAPQSGQSAHLFQQLLKPFILFTCPNLPQETELNYTTSEMSVDQY